jgi:hypothetical protein
MPAVLEVASLQHQDSPILYGVVLALGISTLVPGVCCILVLLFYSNSRLFKLFQPLLTILILTGGVLLSIFCILLLGENTSILCAARPFLFNLAFTLSL